MEGSVKRRPGRPPSGAREALMAAARDLFAERGYEGTTTADVLARSGVSKGAMYHHFETKLDLFEAVYVEVEDASVQRLVEAAGEGGPLERLRMGSRAYLHESGLDGDFARINLTQARRVLGLERWRELGAVRGLAVVRLLFAAAVEGGEIAPLDPAAAAEIYTAALIEAGLLVERADPAEKRDAEEAAGLILARLLDGLAAGR